ncbi:MAG TPA: hypothetical protein VH562_05555 [Nitrosopumilaceae archaeon]
MAEPEIVPFAIWSFTTLAIALVASLVYRTYLRRKSNAESSS